MPNKLNNNSPEAIDIRCANDQKISCNSCQLNSICLPISLHVDEINHLDEIVQRSKPLQKGSYLYRTNETFRSIFAVRSGSVKAISVSDNGDEQVTGFYLPGEVVGLDGIANNIYTNSVIALETASVCEIPFHRMTELSARLPSLQHHFFRLMSQEITQDQRIITLLSKSNADQRIAAFLLSISARNRRRKLSATAFCLPMSRTDIGNFLGLTIETVSRVFSRLQKQGVLNVNRKDIDIAQIDTLRRISTGAT
jgi:CRP/FNR family transcriptional regulator